jgi:KipI family sensor histidine kinase inhibitor
VHIARVGAAALLIEVDDPLGWFAALVERRHDGQLDAVEIVPGARTVLLDGVADPAALAARIRDWPAPRGAAGTATRIVEVPVTFGGDDLPFVAEHWAVDVDTAVRRLVELTFTVAFCGFAPGFAYLRGLPAQWTVPRLATPRTRVPAGSVGLAGEFAGIYPTASPGGWRLVGHTGTRLFDVDADPPALLTPGTEVRLVAA